MQRLSLVAVLGVMVVPYAASAATLLDTLQLISVMLNSSVGLFVTLAIVVFFWGLIKYLSSVGEQKTNGLKIMYSGVMVIFVMVSIWGLVRLLQNTFKVTDNEPVVPKGIKVDLGHSTYY